MAKDTKYISDATKFIRGFLKKHPELIAKQKVLRKTWWDTDGVNENEEKSYAESRDPIKGYSYYSYK